MMANSEGTATRRFSFSFNISMLSSIWSAKMKGSLPETAFDERMDCRLRGGASAEESIEGRDVVEERINSEKRDESKERSRFEMRKASAERSRSEKRDTSEVRKSSEIRDMSGAIDSFAASSTSLAVSFSKTYHFNSVGESATMPQRRLDDSSNVQRLGEFIYAPETSLHFSSAYPASDLDESFSANISEADELGSEAVTPPVSPPSCPLVRVCIYAVETSLHFSSTHPANDSSESFSVGSSGANELRSEAVTPPVSPPSCLLVGEYMGFNPKIGSVPSVLVL